MATSQPRSVQKNRSMSIQNHPNQHVQIAVNPNQRQNPEIYVNYPARNQQIKPHPTGERRELPFPVENLLQRLEFLEIQWKQQEELKHRVRQIEMQMESLKNCLNPHPQQQYPIEYSQSPAINHIHTLNYAKQPMMNPDERNHNYHKREQHQSQNRSNHQQQKPVDHVRHSQNQQEVLLANKNVLNSTRIENNRNGYFPSNSKEALSQNNHTKQQFEAQNTSYSTSNNYISIQDNYSSTQHRTKQQNLSVQRNSSGPITPTQISNYNNNNNEEEREQMNNSEIPIRRASLQNQSSTQPMPQIPSVNNSFYESNQIQSNQHVNILKPSMRQSQSQQNSQQPIDASLLNFSILNFKKSQKGSVDYCIKYNDKENRSASQNKTNQGDSIKTPLMSEQQDSAILANDRSQDNSHNYSQLDVSTNQIDFEKRKQRIDQEIQRRIENQKGKRQKVSQQQQQHENSKENVQSGDFTRKQQPTNKSTSFKNTPFGTEKSRDREIENRLQLERKLKDEKIGIYSALHHTPSVDQAFPSTKLSKSPQKQFNTQQ